MKRIALLICFAVCLFSLIVAPVFAHPGKTDSKGGHTNHSTGEYHYHHGYSAHDHYDMDGDGTVDCPYDFDDKTDHSSEESATVKPKTSQTVSTTEPTSTPTEAIRSDNKPKSNTNRTEVFGWITGIGIYVLSWVVFVIFTRNT